MSVSHKVIIADVIDAGGVGKGGLLIFTRPRERRGVGGFCSLMIARDMGEAEVVSPTQNHVQVLGEGEGQGVRVGGFCTLDHSPVPGTSDGG